MFGLGAGAGAAALGAFTVTRALAVALPPSPVAVIVYVVDVPGLTDVEPCGATLPTAGSIVRSVALVEDHDKFAVCPEVTVAGLAFSVTVG